MSLIHLRVTTGVATVGLVHESLCGRTMTELDDCTLDEGRVTCAACLRRITEMPKSLRQPFKTEHSPREVLSWFQNMFVLGPELSPDVVDNRQPYSTTPFERALSAFLLSAIPDHSALTGMSQKLVTMNERAATLFDAIAHGDDKHKAWLREAINDHFYPDPKKSRMTVAVNVTGQDELRKTLEMAEKLHETMDKCRDLLPERQYVHGETPRPLDPRLDLWGMEVDPRYKPSMSWDVYRIFNRYDTTITDHGHPLSKSQAEAFVSAHNEEVIRQWSLISPT